MTARTPAGSPSPVLENATENTTENAAENAVADDAVAEVMRQWARAAPELDLRPIAVIGRITRCAALLQQVADAPLGDEELARPEFDILLALRRVGGELTPGRLARETFASPAAVTKRLRGLEERGLVGRRADTRDRRVSHIALTADGRALIDRLVPRQLAYEAGLLSGLPDDDQRELARILADVLVRWEGRFGGLPR
ncbi:MarR family winged helix-turn-helix transcriptional regulator [Nocardia nova]|jgi:DNA-binding MarR family transcriptional regulator|uniref:MarR family winged helix-turn-helix transcriptional regulator n=1 Tax=Nocardia nova TaxID=37330 RepID=UPI001895E4BB|nr:MarR family transcriptional regulator [Nocardia nova]MBF6145603.1 MarR family transcriptional regulator [Nocardia nova]MDN2498563.1 MarR family transcriptional regulator [Nocardia nova]